MSSDDQADTEAAEKSLAAWNAGADQRAIDAAKLHRKLKFREELQRLLNIQCQENNSGTPDFVLASFLLRSLDAFETGINEREKYYGRPQDPRFGTPNTGVGTFGE